MKTLEAIETWNSMNEHQKLLCVQLWREENEQYEVIENKKNFNNCNHRKKAVLTYTEPVNRYLEKIYIKNDCNKLKTSREAYEFLKKTPTGVDDIDNVERKTPTSVRAIKTQIHDLENEGRFKNIRNS